MALVLVVAIASVHLAVRAALTRCAEPRGSIAWAATLALLAVLPELLGRAFDSLAVGVSLTALLCAPLALWQVRARRAPPQLPSRAAPLLLERLVWFALVALGAWVALTTFLWDEGSTHFGVSAGMARGVLPAEHPLFPGEPFAYHLGYDVLVALVVRCSSLPIDACCDVVTVACLVALAAVLADAGRALAGPRGAWLALLLVPLGYGPAAALLADGWGTALPGISSMPQLWVSAQRLPPPVISSFFQHPQGLGMPVALAALLLAGEPPSLGALGAARARWLLAAALLALLAPAQTVFFLLTGLALGVMVLVEARALRRWSALWPLVPLALAALAGSQAAPLLRGAGAGDVLLRGYFDDAPAALLLRHLLLFGATVVAIPLALLRVRKQPSALRAGLIAAAAAGFFVANTLSYARSWDGVKFFAVGAFFANLLLAELIAVWGAGSVARRALGALVLLASIWSSGLWLLRHGPLNGVVAARYTERGPDAVGAALAAAFGDQIPARARVLTSHTDIHQAGFHVEGADWRRGGEGYRLNRAAREQAHAAARRALRSGLAKDLLATEATLLLTKDRPAADAPVTRMGEVAGFTLYRINRQP